MICINHIYVKYKTQKIFPTAGFSMPVGQFSIDGKFDFDIRDLYCISKKY